MSIKEITNEKGEKIFQVRQSRRHPLTGKPQSLIRLARSRSQAERMEKQLIQDLADKIHRQVVPCWKEMLGIYEKYAREEQGLTERTIHNVVTCLKAHTLEDWGDSPIDRITRDEIRQFVATRFEGNSEGHKRNMLKHIRCVYRVAEELGHIQKNPTPTLKFKHRDKLKTVLNKRQASLLLAKAKELQNPWYPHWCLALFLGLRSGELYALKWTNVSFEERQVQIKEAWNNKDGFKCTKSGDERAVYIADELLPVLRELKLKSNGSEFVLSRLPGWKEGRQANELRKFLIGIGLPPVRFHDLRATWATLLLNAGVEPAKVMVMGGWKDFKTMMLYIRKAGIDTMGSTNALQLHDPFAKPVNVQPIAPALQHVAIE